MNKLASFLYLVLLIITLVFTDATQAQKLWLDKKVVQPDEMISVHFKAPSSFANNAWVGIIPSHVPHGSESENDKHDLTYQYLKKRTAGSLIFKAPQKPGSYDFRMHDTDNNGSEVASVSFTVEDALLWLDKTVFSPGGSIKLNFKAPPNFANNAWVGIIPSHVPHGSESENDKHDLTYQYLKKRTAGSLIFKAPQKPGSYDFRMHDTDNNGREVASVSFKVR